MCDNLQLKDHNYTYICPTYKHTITYDIMSKYVTTDRVCKLRHLPMKRSEISIYLNFKSILEYIVATYKDGIFLILESDVYILPEIKNFNNCLNKLENKEWSAISISLGGGIAGGEKCTFNKKDSYTIHFDHRENITDYQKEILENNCVEDLSTPCDTDVRFMRKYQTRCADSQLFSYTGCCQILNNHCLII